MNCMLHIIISFKNFKLLISCKPELYKWYHDQFHRYHHPWSSIIRWTWWYILQAAYLRENSKIFINTKYMLACKDSGESIIFITGIIHRHIIDYLLVQITQFQLNIYIKINPWFRCSHDLSWVLRTVMA